MPRRWSCACPGRPVGSLQAALAALLASLALAGGAYLKGRADGREAAQERHAIALAQATETARRIEQQARRRAEEVDREHQAQLQELEGRYRGAASRIGPVRVCPPAPSDPVPRAAGPASGDHGAADRDRLPEPAGARDIGPDLVELARLADRQTAQLIACQAFVRDVTGGNWGD